MLRGVHFSSKVQFSLPLLCRFTHARIDTEFLLLQLLHLCVHPERYAEKVRAPRVEAVVIQVMDHVCQRVPLKRVVEQRAIEARADRDLHMQSLTKPEVVLFRRHLGLSRGHEGKARQHWVTVIPRCNEQMICRIDFLEILIVVKEIQINVIEVGVLELPLESRANFRMSSPSSNSNTARVAKSFIFFHLKILFVNSLKTFE